MAQHQVTLVKELVDVQAKQHALTQDYMERYVLEEWLQIEAELTRERALWGPFFPSKYANNMITDLFTVNNQSVLLASI